MNSIYLKYGFTTKPTLADRNAESGVGNWTSNGNHTITQSNTKAYSGTYSFKIVASAGGDLTTNYAGLPSANNATFVVAKQYAVTMWVWSVGGQNFNVATGGAAYQAFALTASQWNAVKYIFTAVTAATDLQLILSSADTVYVDNIVVSEVVQLTVLSERGMTDPDMFDFFPGLQYKLLDGTIKEYINGFRRKILVDVGVVSSADDRKRILYWMLDTTRTVDYLTEADIPLALEDISGYRNEWKYDTSLMRYFVFALQEPSIRTSFPV